MTLLDRYIFKSALFICAAAVGLFAFLLIVGNFVHDLIGPLLSGQFSSAEIGRLVLLLIPFVISYALPTGMLTGVLLTLGRMAADNEITAMRAAGISLTRIARPVLVLGVLGMAIGLRTNLETTPWANVQYEKEFTTALRANPFHLIVPRTFVRDFPGYVIYVESRKGMVMKNLWLWEVDADRKVTRFVRAGQGHLAYEEATNEFVLTLNQVQVENRNAKSPENFADAEPVASFERSDPERISLNRIFTQGAARTKLRWLTFGQLKARERGLARETPPPEKRQEHARMAMAVAYALQEKFTTALAILSFTLVGVPLAIKVSRREASANLGIAVLLALGYYFLTVAVGWLIGHPAARPDLLLWLPNAILIGLAGWMFARIDRT